MDFIAYHGFSIRWKIRERSKRRFYLTSIPGVFILNPLEYYYFNTIDEIVEYSVKFKGEILLTTKGLIVGSENELKLDDEKIIEELSSFFRTARSLSLQYDLDYKTTELIYKPKANKDSTKIEIQETHSIGMPAYRALTFLYWNDLKTIDKIKSRGEEVPIDKEIFLDAFEAHLKKDFRKSILYFAMSNEIAISTAIEIKYKALLAKGKLKNTFANPNTGNIKDPVFELLQENRWQFKIKLHQQFLYLFNRSLLLENKTLYDDLVCLYETRNKIVHQGEIDIQNKNKLLSIDYNGSEAAIDNTIKFFSWLGDDSLNSFKIRKMKLFRS